MGFLNVWPGKSYPLGASYDGNGTNFALFSENATSVQLLLFDSADAPSPHSVIPVRERHAYVWHCYLPDVKPGQHYAYRVDGPYDPNKGQRFNPAKALIDPYAKAIAGTMQWDDALFGYKIGDPDQDLSRDDRESCSFLPKCVVIDCRFDWEGDKLLEIPWNETIIYETHVRGMTIQHPDVAEELRGTFAGLASPPILEYLKDLGITAVELMPVHQHVDDRLLVEQGLKNYWGYNTIGYFAPDYRYTCSDGSAGQGVCEFKEMVKEFHKAGIEVILDVVYNHTAEGNHLGPTLSFRGIDNPSYYHLNRDDPRFYMDFTGTGNSMNMAHPHVTQLIMDSLRYWVLDMHVDGFRFDLASTLARELVEVDRLAAFFDIIQQDPVLSQVKLIAEPWDVGRGGYQVGNFPPLWAEWNGKYRETVRMFWKGDRRNVGELGYRLSGSSDLYQGTGREPYASINYITAHDGFTLNDLVSYNYKHNEANKQDNKDGMDNNMSWNCGVEGPTDDEEIKQLRMRQRKNFLATLFLSQGVPMLLGGDEFGRTQQGNNNAYCQDNEISWFDWKLDDLQKQLLEFTKRLIHLRREHHVLRRKHFFQGRRLFGSDVKDIVWLKPNGEELTQRDWEEKMISTIGVMLSGRAMEDVDKHGRRIQDDTFLMLLNNMDDDVIFHLPNIGDPWKLVFYTDHVGFDDSNANLDEEFQLVPKSLALLRKELSRDLS